jgi:hypothetical protein
MLSKADENTLGAFERRILRKIYGPDEQDIITALQTLPTRCCGNCYKNMLAMAWTQNENGRGWYT